VVSAYCDQPYWIVRDQNEPKVIRLGSRVATAREDGFVTRVDQDALHFQTAGGENRLIERTPYKLFNIFYEQNGRFTIIYPMEQGNLDFLLRLTGQTGEAERPGQLFGFFPVLDLEDLLAQTCQLREQGFPVAFSCHDTRIAANIRGDKLMQLFQENIPFSMDLEERYEDRVWYTGLGIPETLAFLGVSEQKFEMLDYH